MPAFPIPNEALDDRLAIVGAAGSGKTYTAIAAVERILKRNGRVIVIDPLGVWFGLRLEADGKTPSQFNPIIFGGERGDLPASEHSGALIGETVAGVADSCILDLSSIGTKNGERRFMLAFLTALYRKTNGEPVHIVFDEADMFAPQKLLDKEGDAAKLLGMMETIVRRGRVKGFIPWLITQRPAVLSKDILSQADGVVAMKMTGEHDRRAIGGWIEVQADPALARELLNSLASKQQGEGLVWIPSRGILDHAKFPAKSTFDSSRTPKRGEKKVATSLKALDLGKLKEKLAAVETETKANDPAALKRQIAALQADLRSKPQAAATELSQAVVERLKAEGYKEGYNQGMKQGSHSQMRRVVEGLAAAAMLNGDKDALGAVKWPSMDFRPKREQGGFMVPIETAREVTGALPKEPNRPRAVVVQAPQMTFAGVELTGPFRRILRSLGFWKSIGHMAPTREQVAFVAGYSARSSGFEKALSSMKTSGLIDYPNSGSVAALMGTGEGMSIDEARGIMFSVLPKPHQRIVAALNGSERMSRVDLAVRSDYSNKSSGFEKTLSALKTLGVVTYPSSGEAALSDWAAELLT